MWASEKEKNKQKKQTKKKTREAFLCEPPKISCSFLFVDKINQSIQEWTK